MGYREWATIVQLQTREDYRKMLDDSTPNDILIVLPRTVILENALIEVQRNQGSYTQFIHWNNSGQLDGFIDASNNVWIADEEYDKRKDYCAELQKIKVQL